MLMKLYEINSELLKLDDLGENTLREGGDLELLKKQWDELMLDRTLKIEGICCMIKDKLAFAGALKDEESALSERRRVVESSASWLKNYLASCMIDREKFDSPRASVSWRKSEAVEIVNEFDIPDQYVAIKQSSVIDKTAIKAAIKNGEVVRGASLVEKQNIQIK